MENIEYTAYVKETLSFIRTLVIKCEEVATVDNKLLTSYGYSVSSDKSTWRYYLNMNGQYHIADEVMSVKSLDTGETIVFNKDNLSTHLATFRSYSSGDYLYEQLVAAYPAQRDLINGILNPIDIQTAINASNYKILQYDDSYIEDNEDHLLPELQKWITSFTFQYFNTDYFITDDLMLPIALATMFGLLTPAVVTIRNEAIGTRYVHSFHVWSRINSYGDFTAYKNILTKEQSLWLYRNIQWLTENAGKQYTFNALIENLLTPRSVPMSEFRLMMNTENQLVDQVSTPIFKRNLLNLNKQQTVGESYYTPERITEMEKDMANDNSDSQAYYLAELKNKGKYSLYSDVPIKLLESSMEEYTNRHELTMMILLRDEWAYLAKNNKYTAVIDVTETTNNNQLRLNMNDAMILWTYLTASARGEDVTNIPAVYYRRVAKLNPPTASDLKLLGDKRYLSDATCKLIANTKTTFPTIISSSVFYNKVKEVYNLFWAHKKIYSQYGDFQKRARVKNACGAMYEDGLLTLTTTKTYEQWFTEKEISLGTMTVDEMRSLAWDIYQKATGFDVYGEDSLRYTQESLIELMMKLSSYTVHTYVEIDDGYETIEAWSRTDVSFNYATNLLVPTDKYFFLSLYLPLIPKLGLTAKVDGSKVRGRRDEWNPTLKGKGTLDLNLSILSSDTKQSAAAFLPRMTTILTSQ